MTQGARICPRCSARVDERRARASPYCLSCGAPLGTPPPTFAGKAPGGGGSALPWLLGGLGLVVVLGIAGVIAIIAVANARTVTPAPVATAIAGPKLESTSTATAAVDAGPSVPPVPATRTARVTKPTPPATVTIPRPTSTPTPVPTAAPRPPTVTPPPDAGIAVLAPFPRAQAQSEVDRVASGLASCKRADGPFGAGSIRVEFEPDGRVGTLSRPPFSGTPVGSCITSRFLAVRVGQFAGSTQRIEKTFIIQE